MPVSSTGNTNHNPGRRRPGRVPVSCAECRRLKLRCDRKVPCETCCKRGCAALCPSGTMQTGKGNRTMAFANADEMQVKIDRLTVRVRQLEDALRNTLSDTPQALLAEDNAPGPSTSLQEPSVPKDEEEGFLNAFGTLSLGSLGDARYFGNTARSEYLVNAPNRSSRPSQPVFPHLSRDIIDASTYLDLAVPESGGDLRASVMELRPTLSEATRLCEIYLGHAPFLWDGIPREELFFEVLAPQYASQCNSDPVNSSHGLSLLFIVFALATLFDMDHPACSIEAEEYYLLSRAALRLASPFTHTTLWSIHSLVQMSYYMELSDREFSYERSSQAWYNIGLAVRLGHSMGLHVNNAHWKLDKAASQKRSNLFWQIFVKDTWMSFSFGRPPSTSPTYIDAELPDEPIEEYQPWLIRYTRLLYNVMTTAFGAIKPTYQIILHLDRKIRDFPVAPKMRSRCEEVEDPPPPMEIHLYRWLSVSAKEAILVHLHRPYFAQALVDQPMGVLKHRFAPSVVSIYRSAWRLIEGFLVTYERVPQIMGRVRLCWSHTLAAAIVMCLIATRAPSSNLAGPALQELDKLCAALEGASETHEIAHNNLGVVKKLRNQGHEAVNKFGLQPRTLMELDRLGGKSQVVATEPSSEFASSSHHSTPSLLSDYQPSPPLSDSVAQFLDFEILHPTIMDDWKTFGGVVDNSTIPPTMFDDPSVPTSSYPDTCMVRGPGVTVPVFGHSGKFTGGGGGVQELYGHPRYETGAHLNGEVNMVAVTVASAGPLALDPSWQSFVEQLGF